MQTQSAVRLNLFVFRSCFRTLAVILFQIFFLPIGSMKTTATSETQRAINKIETQQEATSKQHTHFNCKSVTLHAC